MPELSITFVKVSTALRYEQRLHRDVCCGEAVRNACVNLGIDPDTHDGITRNVELRRESDSTVWVYDPNCRIAKAGLAADESIEVHELPEV